METFQWLYASIGAGLGGAIAGGLIWLWSKPHPNGDTNDGKVLLAEGVAKHEPLNT